MKKKYIFLIVFVLGSMLMQVSAQEPKKDYSNYTKEQVIKMSYDELLDLPFEDLLALANIMGVSTDELLKMILDQEVKSASKTEEKNFNSPLSSSVLYYEEIKASGATCIEEALRLVPGLIVREKTNGMYDIHLRGNDNLPNNHLYLYTENSITLVMIDGRPVYNYAHGGTLWETLPIGLEDIEKIEVVRGPASALYGPNAVSGVINIITKKALDNKATFNADVQAGTLNTKIASISAANGFGKLKMRVSANMEYRDRTTDKIYAYADSSYHSIADAYNNLKTKEGNFVFDPMDDMNKTYPNPGLAKDRIGANGFVTYYERENLNVDFAMGSQQSQIISSTLGDAPTPLSTRLMNTSYADIKANVFGFKPQINYSYGVQDFVKGDEGFKMDMDFLNANLEYDYTFKNLSIRPGIYYQEAKYDDSQYIDTMGNGFLNGKAIAQATAASLRLDYIMFNKLRFIAAARGEQYNHPDDTYISYQLVSSYQINENNMVRLVHAKANRGPFIADMNSNYYWDRIGRDAPRYIDFQGNKDLKLLTMTSTELGYRVKPRKNILVDLDVFYNETNDFAALMPDSVNIFSDYSLLPASSLYARMMYRNLELEAQQMGVSANISYVPLENLALRLYGTYQQTELKNVFPYSHEEAMAMMFEDAYMNGLIDFNGDGYPDDFTGDGIPDPYPHYFVINPSTGAPVDLNADGQITEADYAPTAPWSTQFPDTLIDSKTHKSTPSYYGGFSVNYLPFQKKVNIYANVYAYGEQTMTVKNLEEQLDAKFITSLKIGYKFYQNNWIYVNARNVLNDDKREFIYGDKTKGIYMLGLSLSL